MMRKLLDRMKNIARYIWIWIRRIWEGMGAVKQSKVELQSEGRKWAGNNLLKHVILIQVSTHTLTQEGKYKEKTKDK